MNYPMYDPISGVFFQSTHEYLQQIGDDLNKRNENEDIYLNDAYYVLGIPATEEGCRYGWPKNGTGFQELPYKSKPHWWDSNVIVID